MFSRLRFHRNLHLGSRLSHRHPHRGGFRIEDELAEFLEHPKTASVDDTNNLATRKDDKKELTATYTRVFFTREKCRCFLYTPGSPY
jgi:hypothetical protein